MFLFLSALKLVFEIALLSLLGQGVLYLIAGPRRDTNIFYQLLKMVPQPFVSLARRITPAQVADRHVPFVAFFLLAIGWLVVTFERIRYCVGVGMEACQ